MIGSFLVFSVLALSPAVQQAGESLGESSVHALPAGRDRALVPFRFVMNQVRIDAMVNGAGPFHLVLDTGMPTRGIMLFDSERVRALGLEDSGNRVTVRGAGGKGSSYQAIVAPDTSVELGELKLSKVTAMVLPERAGMPPGMDGIIGGELFFQFAVKIDRKRSRLEVIEPSAFSPAKEASIVRLDRQGGMIFVDVGIVVEGGDAIPARVVIDTGAGHAISLNARDDGTLAPPKNAIDAILGRGRSGAVRGKRGRVRRVELGGFAFENVVASFPDSGHSSPGGVDLRDGNLGAEILKRFAVTFDYAHDRMALEPGEGLDEPFEADMSGIAFGWTTDASLVVEAVLEDSPAAAAGVAVGDQLLKIDGRSLAEIGEGGVRALLTVDGAEVLLTLKRGDETLEKRVRLRRLV